MLKDEGKKMEIKKIFSGNYAGEHWLASFAVAAYTDTPR
jgi:hypothetical protein